MVPSPAPQGRPGCAICWREGKEKPRLLVRHLALKIAFAPSGHRSPLVSLKAVLHVFHGLDGKPEGDFAGAVEKLKQMIANATAKLALFTRPRR
jgi:hypothetical protein